MDAILDWLTGNVSRSGRVWAALLPAIVVALYFLIGLLVYSIRVRIRGHHRDPEVEGRGSSMLLGMYLRLYFAWMMRPFWSLVRLSQIPANALTTLSVLLASGAGVALAAGRFSLGGWLYIFAGVCDFMDGRLARASGKASASGAALDSILDRYADAAVLCGLAWFYRDSWVLLAVILALVGSMLVSYIRARGEGLGVEVKMGLMQRPERILYLGVATALSPILEAWLDPTNPHPIHRMAVAGIVLLAVTTQLTAARRLAYLLRSLGAELLPRWRQMDRWRISLILVGGSVATIGDFLLMVMLVEQQGLPVWQATAVGCGFGAAINVSVISLLTSRRPAGPVFLASRYAFVSLTSAFLNAAGVGLLLSLPLVYPLAWVLVRCAVFLAWNLSLHRDYVFVDASPAEHEHLASHS